MVEQRIRAIKLLGLVKENQAIAQELGISVKQKKAKEDSDEKVARSIEERG